MNKADLASVMASSSGISHTEAQSALNSALDAIVGALKNGDKVSLAGFGVFSTSERAARTGRNPQTGATIQIAAKKVAKFKAGKALAEAIQ